MPDFDELEKMDISRVKLMWTNYPNMPTGANATPELYRKLVDFARRKDIVIVNDNPYSFILNEHPISILEHSGYERVLHRIQLHEQEPQHAGLAHRYAPSNARLYNGY